MTTTTLRCARYHVYGRLASFASGLAVSWLFRLPRLTAERARWIYVLCSWAGKSGANEQFPRKENTPEDGRERKPRRGDEDEKNEQRNPDQAQNRGKKKKKRERS